ncbi:MAG: adenine phosphoribosyltransferase [Candidatus Aureabacteria bacterium]|nr:adenine phosphoribosyltransferase [Candidatus Auribacterota bacterium]
MPDLKNKIRDVIDYPKKGIVFKDITPLLQDRILFREAIRKMLDPFKRADIQTVVGIESRGFIFAAGMAATLGTGFVPVRKKGKLPYETISETYNLEYGTDTLEIHKDAIKPGDKILIVDDLLATGGTVGAVIKLIEQLKGKIVGVSFLIELAFLSGRAKLQGPPVHSVIVYDSE